MWVEKKVPSKDFWMVGWRVEKKDCSRVVWWDLDSVDEREGY